MIIKRRRHKLRSYAYSMFLSLLFFIVGTKMLYADYRHTTTLTTTIPTVTIPQPAVVVQPAVVQNPTVVTTQPAEVVSAESTPQQIHSYITYDIDVKKIFQSNENVRGGVIINNASAAPLNDSFHIRLYHEDKLVKELLTNLTNIPPGQTRYTLDGFGIPQINDSAAADGHWTISIYDLDPAFSKTAGFRIMNATSSNNILR